MSFKLLKTIDKGLVAVNTEHIVLAKHRDGHIEVCMVDGSFLLVDASDLPAFVDMLNRKEEDYE